VEDKEFKKMNLTESSQALLNIQYLLKDTLNNLSHFPDLRKKSILKCLEVNNSHDKRQNLLKSKLENIQGTDIAQSDCDKAFEELLTKKAQKVAKKDAIKDVKRGENIFDSTGNSTTQSTMRDYYKTKEVIIKVTIFNILSKFYSILFYSILFYSILF